MEVNGCLWDSWVEEAISKLESLKVLRSLRPIHLPSGVARQSASSENFPSNPNQEFHVFDGPHKWDRASVEVNISESTFQKWLHDVPSSGTVQFVLRVFVLATVFLFLFFFSFVPFLTKLVKRFHLFSFWIPDFLFCFRQKYFCMCVFWH